MSEEDYYIDILNNEEDDEEPPKKQEEFSWGSETPPERQPDPNGSDPYQSDTYQSQEPYQTSQQEAKPPQEEYYGDSYYQDYQVEGRSGNGPPKEERPWFWIGVLIAIGASVVVMLIFNFVGTSSHPGLAYLEIVFLLICCTLPGLFVRKVGKGILGGMMIFGLQFFIPLIVFYAGGQNPTLFFSPYLIFLNALSLIMMGLDDVFGFSFVPIDQTFIDAYDQYASWATFVWVFDLLIMFGIMISLVIASSWLFSNLFTQKAKSFWTWCLLPGQAMVIILNLVVIPWLLLCTSSGIQIGGSLAAGAANVAEIAMPFVDGNATGFENLDTEAILAQLDRADYWFEIARNNYGGLNRLQFLRLMKAASMQYGFVVDIFNATIFAGFELLQALGPLGHGFFDNSNNSDVEVDGFYYQYNEFMEVYDTFSGMFNMSSGMKPSETELVAAEVQVEGIINDIEYLLDEYFDEIFAHILTADAILSTINPEDMRDIPGNAQVAEVLNQVADGLDMVMNVTDEYRVLVPLLLDLIDSTPNLLRAMFNMLVGNVRLIMGYQFIQSQTYLTNASAELSFVQAIFTPARRVEVEESSTALGFFDFVNDTLSLLTPIIAEEGYIGGTVGNIINAIDVFHDEGTNTTKDIYSPTMEYDQVFANMSYSISNSTAGIAAGAEASAVLTHIGNKANSSGYSIMSEAATTLAETISSAFQPVEFALEMDYITKAVNGTFAAIYYISKDDEVNANLVLAEAEAELDDGIALADANPGTPIAIFKAFMEPFKVAIGSIKQVLIDYATILPGSHGAIGPLIGDTLLTLHASIHLVVDEGLPA